MKSDVAQPKMEGTVSCRILRLAGESREECTDALAVEEPLEIRLSYEKRKLRVERSISVTMRTPGDDPELAIGFLLGEQIITRPAEVEEIALPEPNVVRVTLAAGVKVETKRLERSFYTTSSCGVCGRASLAAIDFHGQPLVAGEPRVEPEVILRLPQSLREIQRRFETTGALHAAALFEPDGTLVDWREDVGRHNAVDKVIGAQVLGGNRERLRGLLLFVSGRASFELMQKALLAGVPFLGAIGAPSSLAVELAQYHGATLVGFVRDGRFNIYCGASRITGQDEPTEESP